MKRKFIFKKIIRDKILEIMESEGISLETQILEGPNKIHFLKEKLIEECHEVFDAKSKQAHLEELGDVYDVIDALAKVLGIDLKSIHKHRLHKCEQKGGFEKGLFCDHIEMMASHKRVSYYLERPGDYPEMHEDIKGDTNGH